MEKEKKKISFFQRHLSIWVLLCMVVGILIGNHAYPCKDCK